jgi:type I restriction enzyme S subunit
VSYLLKNPKKSIFASYLIRFNPYIDKKYFKFFLESTSYSRTAEYSRLEV